jgi:hypothetical protein
VVNLCRLVQYKKKGDFLLGDIGKVQVKFKIKLSKKAQIGSRDIALLFL